jgi:hypothetical protein
MNRERMTALVSAMTAIAILGAMVTAEPSRPNHSDRLASLESDLRYQIDLGARVDAQAAATQKTQLEEALAAWRKAPRTPDNDALLTDWLRASLLRSLPGETGSWPTTPEFDRAQVVDTAHGHVDQDPHVHATIKVSSAEPIQAEPLTKQGVGGRANVPVGRLVRDEKLETPRLSVQATAVDATVEKPAKKPLVAARLPIFSEPEQVAEAASQSKASHSVLKVPDRPAPTAVQTAKVYEQVEAEPVVLTTPAPPTPVEVNLAELNARIGGYHDGLREVEATVVARQKQMNVEEVTKLVDRLEELAAQYEFVEMYYELLSADERHFVMAPRSLVDTVRLVEQQRSRVESTDGDHFASAGDAGDSELAQRLLRLAEIALKQ